MPLLIQPPEPGPPPCFTFPRGPYEPQLVNRANGPAYVILTQLGSMELADVVPDYADGGRCVAHLFAASWSMHRVLREVSLAVHAGRSVKMLLPQIDAALLEALAPIDHAATDLPYAGH